MLQLKDAVRPTPPSIPDQVQERLGLKPHVPTLSERVEQQVASIRSTATSGMEALLSAAAHATEPEPPSTIDRLLQGVGLKAKPPTMTERAKSNMQQQREQLKESTSKLFSNLASTQETIGNSLHGAASQLTDTMHNLRQHNPSTATIKAGLGRAKEAAFQRLASIKQALGYKSSAEDVHDAGMDDGLKFAEHTYHHVQEAVKNMNRQIHEQLHGAKESHTTSFDEVERSLSAKV